MTAYFSDNSPVPADEQFHRDPLNPNVSLRVLQNWCPPGVVHTIGGGATAALGFCEDGHVLKYARRIYDVDARRALQVESQILQALGQHERLVEYVRTTDCGLVLRYAVNGDIHQYIRKTPAIQIRTGQRLLWAEQAAEAVSFVHSRGVIHSDIHPNNFLLDENMNIRLCDFSGSTLGALDGQAMESSRYWLPRDPIAKSTLRSDLFALGSVLYWIITGHEPYENLLDTEVTSRFAEGEHPALGHIVGYTAFQGCWEGAFEDAEEVT